MKILVTGSTGQLGWALQHLALTYPQHDFVFTDRKKLSLEALDTIIAVLDEIQPDCIVNAAAYTAVDQAEAEFELTDLINHQAVGVLANWCVANKAKLIHISTDYVFEGNLNTPRTETAVTSPINVYGVSKLKGENKVLASGADAIVIRTSWVYGLYGHNFVKTMCRLMQEKERITVVQDQIGSPTYANDLAEVILTLLDSPEWKKGVYHYANAGKISWYEFALKIKELKGYECEVLPIDSSAYVTAAKRPRFSLLDTSKIRETFGIEIPNWQESLQKMLAHYGN